MGVRSPGFCLSGSVSDCSIGRGLRPFYQVTDSRSTIFWTQTPCPTTRLVGQVGSKALPVVRQRLHFGPGRVGKLHPPRAGWAVPVRRDEDALHVRIVGSKRVRVDRLTSMGDVTREEARAAVESRGNFRSRYVHLLFGKPIEQALLYDLILRRDRLDIRACVEVIIKTFGQRSMRVYPPAGEALDDERLQPSEPSEQTQSPAFANQSEEEFARLLDYYQSLGLRADHVSVVLQQGRTAFGSVVARFLTSRTTIRTSSSPPSDRAW